MRKIKTLTPFNDYTDLEKSTEVFLRKLNIN